MTTTDPLEKALHAALRPVDPGAAFTSALQARLAGAESFPVASQVMARSGRPRAYSASLGLAASIVVAVGIGWQLLDVRTAQRAAQVQQEQARVHNQVLLALEIAGERLGLAQQRIEQYQLQEKSL